MRRAFASGSVLPRLCLALAALACGNSDSGLAPPPAGPEVARDAPVAQPSVVSGDGSHDFVSDPAAAFSPNLPFLSGFSASPESRSYAAPAAAEAGRLYVLSGYAGLVVVDTTDAAAPRVAGRLPLDGLPFSVSVQGGIVLALVNAPALACSPASMGCSRAGAGRAVLIDARDPTRLEALAERELPGLITHADREGSALYVLSRSLETCYECIGVPERSAAVTGFDLRDPLSLADLGQLVLPAAGPGPRQYAFGGGRLFVGEAGDALRVVELEGEPRLGASAPYPLPAFTLASLSVEAGVVRAQFAASDGPSVLDYQVSASGALTPIDPALFVGLSGEGLQPVFDGAVAYVAGGGRSLSVYDLSDRLAPRALGSVELPSAVSGVVAVAPGRVVAFGAAASVAGVTPLHVTLVDVSQPAAPVVLSDVSGPGSSFANVERPRFDAASGVLLLPYRTPSPAGDGEPRVQLVRLTADTLALGVSAQPADGFEGFFHGEGDPRALDTLQIVDDRLVDSRFDRVYMYPVGADSQRTQLRLAEGAGAVRVSGDRLVRFPDIVRSPELVPRDAADLLTAAGTAVADASSIDLTGTWQARAFSSGGQLYLTRSGNGAAAFGLYGFDMTDPGSALATGSVRLDAGDGGGFFDALQSSSSLVVPRGRAGSVDFYQLAFDATYPGTALSYDIVDLRSPAAPRLAASFDVPSELAEAGFQRGVADTTLDTPWSWQAALGSPIMAGDLLVTQHSEATIDGRRRYYLDRLDLSDPSAPRLLPPVNIPGSVLAFDAANGAFITLETLIFEERGRSQAECEMQGQGATYGSNEGNCRVWRRALASLTLDGDVATRQSRLVLDDTRRAALFAVSDNQVFYVTEPLDAAHGTAGGTFPTSSISLERVRLVAGKLERQPSIDIAALHPDLPRNWRHVVARGNRVFALSGDTLGVIDVGSDRPALSRYPLPPWGCPSFDVAGDTAYCARGTAGVLAIDLTSPPSP